jgi:hypothetical protein
LSCLIHASCWANAPRWGGRLRCWLAAPLPLPQTWTWTCCAVQIATRVPLSLYLDPRLVNVVSLRKRPNSLYLQNKLSPYLDALQHLSPLPPVLRSKDAPSTPGSSGPATPVCALPLCNFSPGCVLCVYGLRSEKKQARKPKLQAPPGFSFLADPPHLKPHKTPFGHPPTHPSSRAKTPNTHPPTHPPTPHITAPSGPAPAPTWHTTRSYSLVKHAVGCFFMASPAASIDRYVHPRLMVLLNSPHESPHSTPARRCILLILPGPPTPFAGIGSVDALRATGHLAHMYASALHKVNVVHGGVSVVVFKRAIAFMRSPLAHCCFEFRHLIQPCFPTTAMSGGTAKRHAPHCPPKRAVSTPLHLPLSTRLDEISCL